MAGVARAAEELAAALEREAAAWQDQGEASQVLCDALLHHDAPGILAAAARQQVLSGGGPAGPDVTASWQRLCAALDLVADPGPELLLQALRAAGADTAAQRLLGAATALAEATARVARLNAGNIALARQGLAFTTFALRCLTAADAIAPTYTAAGRAEGQGRRVIDAVI